MFHLRSGIRLAINIGALRTLNAQVDAHMQDPSRGNGQDGTNVSYIPRYDFISEPHMVRKLKATLQKEAIPQLDQFTSIESQMEAVMAGEFVKTLLFAAVMTNAQPDGVFVTTICQKFLKEGTKSCQRILDALSSGRAARIIQCLCMLHIKDKSLIRSVLGCITYETIRHANKVAAALIDNDMHECVIYDLPCTYLGESWKVDTRAFHFIADSVGNQVKRLDDGNEVNDGLRLLGCFSRAAKRCRLEPPGSAISIVSELVGLLISNLQFLRGSQLIRAAFALRSLPTSWKAELSLRMKLPRDDNAVRNEPNGDAAVAEDRRGTTGAAAIPPHAFFLSEIFSRRVGPCERGQAKTIDCDSSALATLFLVCKDDLDQGAGRWLSVSEATERVSVVEQEMSVMGKDDDSTLVGLASAFSRLETRSTVDVNETRSSVKQIADHQKVNQGPIHDVNCYPSSKTLRVISAICFHIRDAGQIVAKNRKKAALNEPTLSVILKIGWVLVTQRYDSTDFLAAVEVALTQTVCHLQNESDKEVVQRDATLLGIVRGVDAMSIEVLAEIIKVVEMLMMNSIEISKRLRRSKETGSDGDVTSGVEVGKDTTLHEGDALEARKSAMNIVAMLLDCFAAHAPTVDIQHSFSKPDQFNRVAKIIMKSCFLGVQPQLILLRLVLNPAVLLGSPSRSSYVVFVPFLKCIQASLKREMSTQLDANSATVGETEELLSILNFVAISTLPKYIEILSEPSNIHHVDLTAVCKVLGHIFTLLVTLQNRFSFVLTDETGCFIGRVYAALKTPLSRLVEYISISLLHDRVLFDVGAGSTWTGDGGQRRISVQSECWVYMCLCAEHFEEMCIALQGSNAVASTAICREDAQPQASDTLNDSSVHQHDTMFDSYCRLLDGLAENDLKWVGYSLQFSVALTHHRGRFASRFVERMLKAPVRRDRYL